MHMPDRAPDATGMTRREFLAAVIAAGSAQVVFEPGHPEPRKGISGTRVLRPEAIPEHFRRAFAAVRANPRIFDGVQCPCGCHADDRSLLVCFESMEPIECGMCERAVDAVVDALANGGDLQEARAAVDRRFGPPG